MAEPGDRAQRGAQVVRDRVAERLELLVGRLELGRALADPLLELRVQPRVLDRQPGAVGQVLQQRDVVVGVARARRDCAPATAMPIAVPRARIGTAA